MPVPKRRLSKSRQGNRRSQIKLMLPNLTPCPNCGSLRVQYKVCPNCGYYNGKEAKEVGPKIKVKKITQETKEGKKSEVTEEKDK